MHILTENETNEKYIIKSITNFCKQYKIGAALRRANAYKNKGIPIVSVFMYLVQLVYTQKSMYMNIKNDRNFVSFGKDAVYRFLNSPSINWTTFLLNIGVSVIKKKLLDLTSKERIKALVIDDTLYARPKSKKVELLANVYDHTNKGSRYTRGFRMLAIAWTDGVTLIPLFFRHLSSEKKRNRYNEINEQVDKRSCGYQARKQAISTSPKVLLEALAQIVTTGVAATHILFDSWFALPATIIEINRLKFKVVARLKKSSKLKYLYNEKKKTTSQIYAEMKKRRGKSKYLLSVVVQLYNKKDEKISARIVYVRNRNNKKNWIALISTDMSLSEEDIISLYGRRWDIEVFFKVCKSYIKLGSEFQQLSYDAITAHTTIVMMRYIILALEKRCADDQRTLGELFYLLFDEVTDVRFIDALEMLFCLIRCELELLFLSREQIDDLMDKFIKSIPECFKAKIKLKKVS